MKLFKLSGLVALFLLVAVSCTKDSATLSSSQESTVLASQNAKKADELTPDKKPLLTASLDKDTYRVGDQVTISYTAKNSLGALLDCGKVSIYQEQPDGSWLEVKKGASHTVSYSFQATEEGECAYRFRAGFAGGAGDVDGTNCGGKDKVNYAGVDTADVEPICVIVKNDCVSEFTIEDQVEATPLGDGMYEFKVTYTLTSPVAYDNIKFQGGATAGGKKQHEMVDYGNTTIVNQNLQNTVLMWNGALEACKPVTVTFSYKRLYQCADGVDEITGKWSVEAGGEKIAFKDPLTYSCP